jgi:dienelactone hydrolase
MDRPIAIHVRGLEPLQAVTIRASSVDKAGKLWLSALELTANVSGSIDLPERARKDGRGHAASELLTSMTVRGEDTPVSRFEVSWADTVITVVSLEVDGRDVIGDTLRRTFGPPDITAKELSESGLVGTLFEHSDGKRRPGILVLGGSEGGNSAADIAYQLAGNGYTTLSLAYFGAAGVPAQLAEIPLEYFAKALGYLRERSSVRAERIAIFATSKGAEAALLVASHYHGIAGVIAYAPSSVAWSCICDSASHSSWTFNGRSVPAVPPGTDTTVQQKPPIRPTVNYSYRLGQMVDSNAVIDGRKIRAPVFLIAGGDDGLWPSAAMASSLFSRLSPASLRAGSQLTIYASAGHLISKFLLPAGSTLVARGRIQTGGSPAANAEAGADAWPRVLAFLRKSLGH